MDHKRNNSKRIIFKRYLARYLLVVFLVIFCCIPFGINVYSKIKEYALTVNVQKLKGGINQINRDVEKMQMISAMLGKELAFLELQKITGEVPMEKYLYMKDAKERLAEISSIYDFPKTIFCVYRNNDIFVSNNQVSEKSDGFYGRFVGMDDLDSSSFRDVLFLKKEEGVFLSTEEFFYYDAAISDFVRLENALLYLQPVGKDNYWSSQKALIVFVIDRHQFLNLLVPENVQDEALLLVKDINGQELVAFGRDIDILRQNKIDSRLKSGTQSYQVFRYQDSQNGLEIAVGFPMASIHGQIYEIGGLLLIYILCGTGAALLFTVVGVFIWYRPLGKMLDEVSRLTDRDVEKNNEYDYIRESFFKLVSDKDELETKMLLINAEKQAIMLEKVFMNGFPETELQEWFIQKFPFTQNGYFMVRVLIRQIQTEVDTQMCLLYATEILKKEGGYHFVQIYPRNNVAVFLIADENREGERRLKEVMERVCAMVTKSYSVYFTAGISRRHEEIEKINLAFVQAKQTVAIYKENPCSHVEIYQKVYDTEKNCFHMEELQKMYDYIISANVKAVKDNFSDMKQEIRNSYEKYEFRKTEIYYAISFVLQSVCQQKSLPVELHFFDSVELQNMTLFECLNDLEENSIRLCETMKQRKNLKNIETCQRLMKYMQTNFRRASLTADLVAREAGTSEKYVYSLIKEETGKTFSNYLDELRVSYAKECLKKTKCSNEKIAEETGFGAVNSFYRVFKKYTGLSPKAYRDGAAED